MQGELKLKIVNRKSGNSLIGSPNASNTTNFCNVNNNGNSNYNNASNSNGGVAPDFFGVKKNVGFITDFYSIRKETVSFR